MLWLIQDPTASAITHAQYAFSIHLTKFPMRGKYLSEILNEIINFEDLASIFNIEVRKQDARNGAD
jgi:hypothetical protein